MSDSGYEPKLFKQFYQQTQQESMSRFRRMNPLMENVVCWKEKGRLWCGEDRNVTIYDSTTLHGNVDIGLNTWIGPFCSLDGGEVGLTIGKNCSISAACHILTHDSVRWALSGGKAEYEYAATSIGDFCFVATGCVITKGVRLGKHCLVAANSVVTKSFPDNSIVGGVPAKRIGTVVIDTEGDVELHYFSDEKDSSK
ncbi:MAG: acyltransferase [Pseudomonadota bacterium]|uniref:Acyltransferase n=1 Tax=Alteromonas oceani TaxID=2071609 RepID=A0ABV7JTA2_9ALTE|nr:acyltransferase [Alteromonas oceani]MEC9261804.1 acyltransferase [Pseudomonadota bacterium]